MATTEGSVTPRQLAEGFYHGVEQTFVDCSDLSVKGKERRQRLRFVTQNCGGLKRDEDFEDLFSSMRDENVFAACLQETWREGLELLDRPGLGTVVLAGKRSQSGRGSLGVGIALGLKGVQAWKDAGSVVHDGFGPCAMAIRLLVQGDSGEEVGIHLVSLYTGTVIGTGMGWRILGMRLLTANVLVMWLLSERIVMRTLGSG